jgi:hypothetical protein
MKRILKVGDHWTTKNSKGKVFQVVRICENYYYSKQIYPEKMSYKFPTSFGFEYHASRDARIINLSLNAVKIYNEIVLK